MFHLSLRVAWHDSRWDGRVCKLPSNNSFCVALDRIREERDDATENTIAGRSWGTLKPEQLPPCKAESGAFMNPEEWVRAFEHPYANIPKAVETHGHLRPTSIKVPPYSTFAVPFAWMLRSEQECIDNKFPDSIPKDEKPPFPSPWVFGRERQEALLRLFFGRLVPDRSLGFFYCKEGQPLGDNYSRLIMGVGRITSIAPVGIYKVDGKKPAYPMWDRIIRHSIRPDEDDGFLLPYHDYIEPTGDSDEDARRIGLLQEIAVPADSAHVLSFSYAAELVSPDIALSTLVHCLDSVRKIREHGIVKGPWGKREEWLNRQIAEAWKDRGPFPGLGPALESIGLRMGTALVLELYSSKLIGPDQDPWPVVDAILRGKKKAPQAAYIDDIKAIQNTWINLPDERRGLLKLLSRFAMTAKQADRWFEPKQRDKGTSAKILDREIIENPYRMSEVDLGDRDDSPVSVGMVDRGLLPDITIAVKHPIPPPSAVGSPNDPRRIRAAIVSVLRGASKDGDALLAVPEVLLRVAKLDLTNSCMVGSDWVATNKIFLNGVVDLVDVIADEKKGLRTTALQLSEHKEHEDKLRSILSKRAGKAVSPPKVDWKKLLVDAISAAGRRFDEKNPRHTAAIVEQAAALERITSRRLSVLVGRAGTGKTSVMGAVMLCQPLAKDGILLLAPTGKARVRLGKATNADAMTVAQFLYQLGRYDGAHQRPLYEGTEKYRKEKTVVIDECSMLTMDDLVAILEALDLAHVQRLILVGDPNQLPPIGVGRPFADLVSYLENTFSRAEDDSPLGIALARLSVEVRTATASNAASDTLRLASWFTREPQPVDADRVLSDLESGASFNDLQIQFWKTPDILREKLLASFQTHLGLKIGEEIASFDTSLGFDEKGCVPFDSPDGAENWQILSPVRMHPYGVYDLNRWVQRQFRGKELGDASNNRRLSLGDENLVRKDKVIQITNQGRDSYDWKNRSKSKTYLANGEVGLVALDNNGFLNVAFAGRANLTFGYRKYDFSGGSGPLELAYALTVHKAQGSEFKKVFVILPKNCRLLTRELLYTALTRSREQLVLLIEGDDQSILFDYTRPERSETARRNTNIFQGVVRPGGDSPAYAEHLIHRTEKGHLVRSKSELVIANMLFQSDIAYEYERVCEGTVEPGRLRPDFSFATPSGDLIVWEHLGMMQREDYRRGWEWKLNWYKANSFKEGETLFTSQEDDRGGLDSEVLKITALQIKSLMT